MTRDFASRAKKRTNATPFNDQQQDRTVLITMVLGLLLGIGITLAAVYYYQNEPETVVDQSPEQKQPPSAKTRYQAVPADQVEKPDFSFHNELENKTVEVEADILPESLPSTSRTWVMQCGSFRQRAMAENLKANIGMNGFEAMIRASENESGTLWYRVVLGPYQSKRQAERERHQLERNNINNCRIW